MKDAIETFARLGIMGFLAVVVICTLVGLAVYGFVVRPDHDLTAQLVGILGVGAGALLTAVGAFFGAKRDTIRLDTFSIPPDEWLPVDVSEGKEESEGEGEPPHQVQ